MTSSAIINSTNELPKVVVSATFTIDYLLPNLDYLLNLCGLKLKVDIAPYHQIHQQLLDSSSLSSQNSSGINVFIIRLEDYVRDEIDSKKLLEQLSKVSAELFNGLSQFTQKYSSPTILALLPCSPRVPSDLKSHIDTAIQLLQDNILKLVGITQISSKDFSDVLFDINTGYDAISDNLAHVPLNEDLYAALALVIARKIHLLKVPARKVLVLDCDNTIWQGVVGEDGVDGIKLTPGFLSIQQYAINMQAQGVLICLASKNAEQDVLDVLERRPDMLLKKEHIVAHRINWEPKFQNLQSLATELNLGLDSFVFLDDNPVECGQMRQALPKVMTLQIPSESQVASFLSHLWAFDKLVVTEEDTKRTKMYRENNARQQMEESTSDIGAFIASLELVIEIDQPNEEEWSRVAQLTQRTNQFNFTTVRRNEPDIRALAVKEGYFVNRIKVKDRFGDYGLVGLSISCIQHNTLVVDTLLLSCRVLGRGVEHAILKNLGELALVNNCDYVDLVYVLTPKNEPARAFADHVALDFKIDNTDRTIYHIPVKNVSLINHIPGGDPEAVLEASRSDGKKKPTPATLSNVDMPCSDIYEKLSTQLVSGQALVATIRSLDGRARTLHTEIVEADTELERELLIIWQNLLGLTQISVEDDYFAIGGTSLHAARLFAEITRRYDVRLKLTAILDAPTIRSLALYIQSNQFEKSHLLVELKPGSNQMLFLVHDGDGETLLYRNLASRMPDDMAVFGIEPHAVTGVPMAHASIDEMADFYVNAIQEKQPQGPYFLGGMCAGGLIAYVMASKLVQKGEIVEMVAIMDAATPNAIKREGLKSQARSARVAELLQSAQHMQVSIVKRGLYILNNLIKKIMNTLIWEISSRLSQFFTKIRFKVFIYILKNNKTWPTWLPELTVREIYNSLESKCELQVGTQAKVLLVRASVGEGNDVPYAQLYADDTFGWRQISPQLRIVNVDGGHASMLQEPQVESLAAAIKSFAQLK